MKSNRKIALGKEVKLQGHWHELETLVLKENQPRLIYPEGLETPVLLIKQIFTNEDGQEAVQYLVTSQTKLSKSEIIHTYQKRRRVEECHKSFKQNVRRGAFSDADAEYPNQSFFRRSVRLYQIKESENQDSAESFCFESKTSSQSFVVSFSNSQTINQGHLSASGETIILWKVFRFQSGLLKLMVKILSGSYRKGSGT